jgi:serine/threonine protein kinase
MPSPVTVSDFLELVRKSGVLDEKRLDTFVQGLQADNTLPTDPTRLADLLLREGLLTAFQAEQLLQGKWRRFLIGKYRVLERIGSGGMGSVYLCEHKFMRRRVAVKVLPTAKAQDPPSLERFYREARAVAALDHPNIVHAYDIDQDENLHFLVMEYVDGANLQELVRRSGPMDPVRAAHYIAQAALGLGHAFERGLIHRDIKPGNLLVDRCGTVKVLDMGLARFFNDKEDVLTKKYDENVLGTADYVAPEQAVDSHDVDVRADIYSLGATFYFLLTGRTPFGEGTVAQKLIWHQSRQPRRLAEVRPNLPPGLAEVVQKMMAKDPAQRYRTPQEIAEALAPWTGTPIPPPAEAEMPRLSAAALGDSPTVAPSLRTAPRKSWEITPPPTTRSKPPPPSAGGNGGRTPPPLRGGNKGAVEARTAVLIVDPRSEQTKSSPLMGETAPLECMGDTQSFPAPRTPPPTRPKLRSSGKLVRPAIPEPRHDWLAVVGISALVAFFVIFCVWFVLSR